MQRELTADLAKIGGLEVISFRYFDCLLFSRGETLKMFQPSSKRIMLGSPRDRRVTGAIIVVAESALKTLKPPSKRYEYSDVIFAAPIENFSGFTRRSSLVDGAFDPIYLERVAELLDALPVDLKDWRTTFGKDFFEWPRMDRLRTVIQFLRERVAFSDPISEKYHFKIRVVDPPE